MVSVTQFHAGTTHNIAVIKKLAERHDDQVLVIGAYLDQLERRAQRCARGLEVAEHRVDRRLLHQHPARGGVHRLARHAGAHRVEGGSPAAGGSRLIQGDRCPVDGRRDIAIDLTDAGDTSGQADVHRSTVQDHR